MNSASAPGLESGASPISDATPIVFVVDDDVLLGAIRHAIERSSAALGDEAEIQALRGCYASLTPRT